MGAYLGNLTSQKQKQRNKKKNKILTLNLEILEKRESVKQKISR